MSKINFNVRLCKHEQITKSANSRIKNEFNMMISCHARFFSLKQKLALSGPTRKPNPTRPEPGQDPASGAHGLKSIPGGLVGF